MTRTRPRDPTALHSRFNSRAVMSVATGLPDVAVGVGGPPEERYERLFEIGLGGMARVFLTRDHRLGRDVALKVSTTAAYDVLFAREATLTASLEHPGVLPVHDRGVDADGRPFFATPFVRGQTLQRWLAEPRTPEERQAMLRTLLMVVETVAFAHARGVVHRDIKPSNILPGYQGHPVIIDWAFGADLHGTLGLPDAPGGGTPRYMSPEQAAGQPPSPRDDVFALGLLLLETISGIRPGQDDAGSSNDSTAQRLARLPKRTPPALAAIIARALASPPERRYPDAAPLARDLRDYLERRPVDVYAYAVWERLSLWLRRWRVPATVGAVALLLLFIVGAVALVNVAAERAHVEALLGETLAASAWRSLEEERRDIATEAARRAIAYKPTAEGHAVIAAVPEGVVKTRTLGPLPCSVSDLAPDQGRSLCAAIDDEQAVLLLDGTSPVARIALPLVKEAHFIAGGDRFVALHAGRYAVFDSLRGDAVMVMPSGCMGRLRDTTGGDATIDFSPWCATLMTDDSWTEFDTLGCRKGGLLAANIDGARARIAVACDDGSVWVHRMDGAAEPRRIDLGLEPPWFGITAIAFIGDSNRVVIGTQHGWLARVDLDDTERRVMLHTGGLIQHIEFDPSGQRVVFRRLDGGPIVMDVEAWSALARLDDDITATAFGRDGKLWTAGRELKVHDLDGLKPRGTTVLAGVTAMAVSPDGRTLAVGQDPWLSTIDTQSRQPLGHFRWQEGVIKSVTYGVDGLVHAHGVGSPDLVAISNDLLQHIAYVTPIDYSLRAIPRDDGSILAAHWNRPVMSWRTGEPPRDIGIGRARDLRLSPNGRDVVALGVEGGVFRSASPIHGVETFVACDHVPGATAIAVTDDGSAPMIAVLTSDRIVGVCGELGVYRTPGPNLASLALSTRWIVAGGREGSVMAWRRGDPEPRIIARAHDERVSAIVIAPDETWFASAGWDGRVLFWQLSETDSAGRSAP